MGLKLPRKTCKPSVTKAIQHLTPGAVLCPATAKVVTALECGSRVKEGSPKSPTAWKSKEYKKARKRPEVLVSTKRSVCGRIFSVLAFDLQPARVYIIPALKRVGVVQTPRQPFEKEFCRCLFIPFRSSFWPCKYPLMNKTSGSSHHDLDNK